MFTALEKFIRFRKLPRTDQITLYLPATWAREREHARGPRTHAHRLARRAGGRARSIVASLRAARRVSSPSLRDACTHLLHRRSVALRTTVAPSATSSPSLVYVVVQLAAVGTCP
jgi:hypothetical protein